VTNRHRRFGRFGLVGSFMGAVIAFLVSRAITHDSRRRVRAGRRWR
jgi:uncharacterized membrane protein YdjX (TVP38/TMEM64 family)